MEGLDLFHTSLWHPLAFLGLTSDYLGVNSHTILNTWVAMAIIIIIASIGKKFLTYPESLGAYLVKSGIQSFVDMIVQSLDNFVVRYCLFITSLFIFIFVCNITFLIPGLEEATKDLNTTFALSITSFLYIQYEIIKKAGVLAYLKEYIKTPLPLTKPSLPIIVNILYVPLALVINMFVAIISFPLELQSKLATILSMSFRLFGNIFGGAIISSIWHNFLAQSVFLQLIGIFFGFNLLIALFFGLFEGFIQAFVFSVLTLTYLSIGIQATEEQS